MENTFTFFSLPLDIVKYIFSYPIHLRDALSLRLVCKDFLQLTKESIQILGKSEKHHTLAIKILTYLPKLRIIHSSYNLIIKKREDITVLTQKSKLDKVYVKILDRLPFLGYINFFLATIDTRHRKGNTYYNYFFRGHLTYFQAKNGSLCIRNKNWSLQDIKLYLLAFPFRAYDGPYIQGIEKLFTGLGTVKKIRYGYDSSTRIDIIPGIEEYDLYFMQTPNRNDLMIYCSALGSVLFQQRDKIFPKIRRYYPTCLRFVSIYEKIFPNLDKISIILEGNDMNLYYDYTSIEKYKQITLLISPLVFDDIQIRKYHQLQDKLRTKYPGKFKFREL